MSTEAQPDVPAEPSLRMGLAEAHSRETLAFKFGGSSLLGAERMLHAASLVREAGRTDRVSGFVLANPDWKNVVVVVSAMKGVTDRLLAIAASIEADRAADALREAEHVLYAHFDVLRELRLDPLAAERVARDLRLLGKDLSHDVMENSRPRRLPHGPLHDRLASYGERFSARLFAAALEKLGVPSAPVSSSEFVLTCETFRNAQPDLEETRRRGRDVLAPLLDHGVVPVVTGFIGSTADGRVTTLGRNSSDFSGALVAHVVDADEFIIWTDVDGIYTADPRESVEAQLLHELSYDQAHALAASGAKVLHAKVLPLAAETETVVWVRNTFNPRQRGTRIGPPLAAFSPAADAAFGHEPETKVSASAATPPTRHSERSEFALADERSRGSSATCNVRHQTALSSTAPSFASNNSVVAAPRGCHNSTSRGEA